MNKTVNINLAGSFFHIDEDAFAKLTRYLEAIKRSFSDPQGRDEIIRDIEARIAELFDEKIESHSQVISVKELDEVIAIMGQPEDYMVDEEIFDDAPKASRSRSYSSNHKQLFRDIDNKFIAGVSAGLGHYLGIDTIWVRLLWILLTIFSSGFFLVVYIIFWVLVPKAESTADKIRMQGDAINIENIEKKIRDEYERVADKVKDVDFDEVTDKVTKKTNGFFETLGNIFLMFFKVFFKFIGIILIIAALSTLVSLIVGLFSIGTIGFWETNWMDYVHAVNTTGAPLWVLSLLVLFAVGIPFFVLFLLGLKILIPNIKSIGTPAKIVLGVIWFASIIILGILSIKQGTQIASEGTITITEALPVQTGDTIRLSMLSNETYEYRAYRGGGFEIKHDEDGNKVIYSNDVRLIVRSTSEAQGRMVIEKSANALEYQEARNLAQGIEYGYQITDGELKLNGYLVTPYAEKYRDQEVQIVVYLPVGTVLYASNNTRSFHSNDSYYDDILIRGDEEEYLEVQRGKTVCLTCPEEEKTETRTTTKRSYSDDWDDNSSDWSDDEDYNKPDDWSENQTQQQENSEPAIDSLSLDNAPTATPVNDSIQQSNNN
ncbi:MAG: PspC domain-containing protein [Gilvibacter sp.]